MAKKTTPTAKAPTKGQILSHIAEETGLTKRDVEAVLDSLKGLIHKNVKPRSVQEFTLPGLLKIVIKKRPATKARKGRNPSTGEEITISAKPAKKVVKVRVLKGLKELAGVS